jgi:glycine cleavage system H protein
MTHIPNDLKYTPSHEWARLESDGLITVGITDHAQQLLGDMVYIEPPEVDSEFEAGDNCGVVESVKAASDIYCPLSGHVVDINPRLTDEPEIVNTDPYGEGWIFKIKPDDEEDIEDLLDASDYEEHTVHGEEDELDDDTDDDEE